MGIYTKGGDKGSTSNLAGNRLLKCDLLIDVQGHIDELNSHVGYLNSMLCLNQGIKPSARKEISTFLEEIQHKLYVTGVEISLEFKDPKIKSEDVTALEEAIDKMTNSMPPQTHFILYSGSPEGTYAHVARAITRRAERAFVELIHERNIDVGASYKYINRLSDYFFTLSRYLNHLQGKKETIMELK